MKKNKNEIEIERACKFCEKAMTLGDEEHVLCSKKGIVSCDYICRKFSYDPLKRRPMLLPDMPELEETDL